MRDILFRGKDKKGIWHYGFPMHGGFTEGGTQIQSICVESDDFYVHEILPETVGQFTGLCDKNGKKVFEGDILKVVELHDGDEDYWNQPCGPAIPTVAEWGSRGWCLPYRVTADFAVIGNIYDNPELIGDKNE